MVNSTSDPRPIGLLDSGVGGLSVLREVRAILPHESLVYCADQGHLPYGERPRDELRGLVEDVVRFLLRQDCKMIVIPCNSACAAGLHYLRQTFPDLPIVGMEPAIKPAAEKTKSGIIGAITTKATFQGELFASVIDRFAQHVNVIGQVCPELVLLVERGLTGADVDSEETRRIVERNLEPLKTAGIDQLVIGCTHFTFLTPQIQAYLGDAVSIVDPAPAVARQVERVLHAHGLATPSTEAGTIRYYTSANVDKLRTQISQLLGDDNPQCFSF